jgi:hypothetical protein
MSNAMTSPQIKVVVGITARLLKATTIVPSFVTKATMDDPHNTIKIPEMITSSLAFGFLALPWSSPKKA